MTAASLPPDEARRLKVLLDLNLLDSPPDERFDRITRLAARLFAVPTALVSLVDAERQWFKSRVGMTAIETPRSESFCAHTILQDDVLVVRDACADERFADYPAVKGDCPVRFYAGSPIDMGDGMRIGTLCIVDSQPREFGEEERRMLRDLAGIVANEVAAGALKGALERERRSAEAVRALLDHLPEGVLLIDETGAIVSCNPAAERMFGAACTVMQGQDASALIGIDPAPLERHEGLAQRADGARFDAELSIAPMTLDGCAHLVVSVRDIAWHRAEQERVRAANQRRHDYFRTASHELRTPMASILGFSELLLKRDFDAATARELLDIVHRQATHLSALVTQVLELARLEAGGPAALQLGPQRIDTIVAQALKSVEHRGQNARIVLDLGAGLPPVAADAHKLCAALVHVLDNSIVYSAPHSPITVRAWRGPDAAVGTVLLRVSDTGIGMSAEQQASMFEAFWRAQPGANPDSTGLGLAIFRETIALHNGSIEVGSTLGHGTDITITLPAAAAIPHA